MAEASLALGISVLRTGDEQERANMLTLAIPNPRNNSVCMTLLMELFIQDTRGEAEVAHMLETV